MGKDLPERELARSTDPHGALWLVWRVGEGGQVFDHSVLEPMKRLNFVAISVVCSPVEN